MKAVVIYKSKSGFAKKYAQWIAEELSADIFDASRVDARIFSVYDTIIYGGSLYAVGINGIDLIKDNLDKLKGKKVVVFTTGASPARSEAISAVCNKNFNAEEQKLIKFFYLRGGFDFSKLTPVNKVLMTMLKLKIKVKARLKMSLIDDEKGMLTAYNRPVDFTRKQNIADLITYVKS